MDAVVAVVISAELIIEEFIKFDSEITLLTVTQKNGPTLFCPPIGHVQKGGDYRESFQPAHIDPAHLRSGGNGRESDPRFDGSRTLGS